MKRFLSALLLSAMLPYVVTLAWTGRLQSEDPAGFSGLWKEEGQTFSISLEDCVPLMLAVWIPADYGEETLKAQAVLLRTWLGREFGKEKEVSREALEEKISVLLNQEDPGELWKTAGLSETYGRLKQASEATEGLALTWEGELIEPFFCRASAGMTRSRGEDYPYLKQTESPGDFLADGFYTVVSMSPGQLADRLNEISGAVFVDGSDFPERIQVVERDGAGYVRQIQMGEKTYTGEEVQEALGLPSACYEFSKEGSSIRVTCKGMGHGYGFSQAGANELEKEGKTWEELLNYYFQNVEIVKMWE